MNAPNAPVAADPDEYLGLPGWVYSHPRFHAEEGPSRPVFM